MYNNVSGENIMNKTIDKNIINEIEIKKSKFICFLFKIENVLEIDKYFQEIQNNYPKATHCCYAYIIDGKEKCSDDKEPRGTAGIPILNVLKNNNLTNILCVVVRYFGGIKLGSGGLIRAYTKSVVECINKVNLINNVSMIKIELQFSYDEIKNIEYIIKDYQILSKNYDNQIIYIINVPFEKSESIINKLDKFCFKINVKE